MHEAKQLHAFKGPQEIQDLYCNSVPTKKNHTSKWLQRLHLMGMVKCVQLKLLQGHTQRGAQGA